MGASGELELEPSDFGALRPGMRLGRYELLVPVARGGMARVWAARQHGQRGFQKLVALKTILPHLAKQTEFERMFLDEARIASGVHHPNVCEIYELGEEAGQLYLAMEWVSGDSFARLLRVNNKPEAIDPRVAARIVADACAGAHAAHELTDEATGRALGVVHRDLSPHNVLLTADGVAKVADFGVAKALGQLHEATSAGELKGKISFMAPEQVTGGAIDRRSDVFSLGVVLYEATTGVRPFKGDGDHQIMHQLLKGEFPSPTSIRRMYPPDLEKIVMRALSPEPIRRYPTAERMRFALEEFLAKGQIVTHSQVAQVVRARMGEAIEARRERIRRAGAAGEAAAWSEHSAPGASMTPSGGPEHHSGVKQARPTPALASTLALGTAPPMPPAQPSAPSQPAYGVSTPPMQPQPNARSTVPDAQPLFAPTMPHAFTPTGPQPQPFVPPAPSTSPVLEPSHPMRPRQGSTSDVSGAFPRPTQPQPQPQPQMGTMPSGEHTRWGPVAMPPTSAFPQPNASPEETKPQGGSYVLAIGIGLLVASVLGGGAYAAVRMRTAKSPPEDLASHTGGVASVSAVVPAASASAMASTAASASAAPAPSGPIVFELTPEDASLTVDGKELPAGTKSVPRPEAGKTVTVVARAKGFEEVTILVDTHTTSPMDIALKAAPEPDPTVKKKTPKADPALPANPY